MFIAPRYRAAGSVELSTDRLKILMVITTLDTGGAEKHLSILAPELAGRGHEIELVFLKGEGSLARLFESSGIQVEKIAFESPLALPGAVARLASKVKNGGFSVVHSHLLKADLVASLSSLPAKPMVLVSSKHNDERALLNPLVSFVHGVISRRADAVIALSDHVARFVTLHGRVAREKIKRIYYGLDPEVFLSGGGSDREPAKELGLDPGVPVLTMVARFAPQKDHETLLKAARRMKDEGRSFRLLLVGDDPFGSNRKKAEAVSRALGLEDQVTFTGIRDDVPDILSLTDVFVMPSLWEGLGLVFLEAMAYSLPVVSNRVSAVPEIVEHGETGFLVPAGDAEALAAALSGLLDDPERAASMGKLGRARLELLFGTDRMVEETEAVYMESMKR